MVEIGFCFDCREMHYAIADSNGVYERNNVSSNHHHCKRVMVFGAPNNYSPPIRTVLTKLQAKAPISHNEIVLFKLAMDLEYDLDCEPSKEEPVQVSLNIGEVE